jgi:hypothetical protein
MKALVGITLAIAGLFAAVQVAATGPARTADPARAQGSTATMYCSTADGKEVIAVKVGSDASARRKAHAIELFKQRHPGWTCSTLRPHHY